MAAPVDEALLKWAPAYRTLHVNRNIVETRNFFEQAIAVKENELVAIVSDQRILATEGLGPCMAFCAQGKTLLGKNVLALCHYSSDDWKIEDICRIVKDAMTQIGCDARTIKCYVIGGEAPQRYLTGTFDDECEIVNAARPENIFGVRFNYVSGEDSASVVLTSNKIFISKKRLFAATNNEKTGIENILRQSLSFFSLIKNI